MKSFKDLQKDNESCLAVVNKVSSWYDWCLQNVADNHGTKMVGAEVGRVSKKQISVKIMTTNEHGSRTDVYITPQPWWVKKFINGQSFGNFSKKLVLHMDSQQIEA